MPIYTGQPLCPYAEEMAMAIIEQQEAGTLDTDRAIASIEREEACQEISHAERERLLHLFFKA